MPCKQIFFKYEQCHRACIANKVDGDDKKSYISADFEAGDEALEEDGLESQVGHVDAQALGKEPRCGRDVECVGICADEGKGTHAEGWRVPGGAWRTVVWVFHCRQECEDGQHDQGGDGVHMGKCPGGDGAHAMSAGIQNSLTPRSFMA